MVVQTKKERNLITRSPYINSFARRMLCLEVLLIWPQVQQQKC